MNFQIPKEVNNDILYCQKSLHRYIHVHQMLAASLNAKNMMDDPRLTELENEILDIGRDQKKIVDKLRLENYVVCLQKQNVSIDRLTANANVANQLFQNSEMCYNKVEPVNVKKRFSDTELIERYICNRATTSGSAAGAIKISEFSKTLQVLTSPSDVLWQNNTIVPQKSQESLLKPKSERLILHSPKNDFGEQLHSASSANLNRRRLNLKQVLQTKAKNQTQNLDQDHKNVKKIDNGFLRAPADNKTNNESEDDDVILIETTPTTTDIISNSSTSSSPASSLSGYTFDRQDLLDEDKDKETFLNVLGLCTPTYRDHLMKKRSARKRRSCTSTKKPDFHYGNIDLCERQSTRPNRRVFLKSTAEPHSIETKVKRRQSNASSSSVKAKSKTKSSSSSKCDHMELCIV